PANKFSPPHGCPQYQRGIVSAYKTYMEGTRQRMSALGQNRTCAAQKPMFRFTPYSDGESGFAQKIESALLPKTDMCGAKDECPLRVKSGLMQLSKKDCYSITSSASAKKFIGSSMPVAFAALRLMTSL